MAITFITTAPDPNIFTPLADFQSQTPESLSDTEVLHYASQVDVAFTPSSASPFQSSHVTVYVTSKIVTLWSDAESKGLTIPYTNIALHAAQGPRSRGENSRGCIYMQLEGASHLMSESTANGNNTHGSPEDCDGEDDAANGLVEVHLTPTDDSTLPAFYEGLCACASLHPDVRSAEEDMLYDNSTWITSENMGAFEDAEEDQDDTADGNVSKWRRTE